MPGAGVAGEPSLEQGELILQLGDPVTQEKNVSHPGRGQPLMDEFADFPDPFDIAP